MSKSKNIVTYINDNCKELDFPKTLDDLKSKIESLDDIWGVIQTDGERYDILDDSNIECIIGEGGFLVPQPGDQLLTTEVKNAADDLINFLKSDMSKFLDIYETKIDVLNQNILKAIEHRNNESKDFVDVIKKSKNKFTFLHNECINEEKKLKNQLKDLKKKRLLQSLNDAHPKKQQKKRDGYGD